MKLGLIIKFHVLHLLDNTLNVLAGNERSTLVHHLFFMLSTIKNLMTGLSSLRFIKVMLSLLFHQLLYLLLIEGI